MFKPTLCIAPAMLVLAATPTKASETVTFVADLDVACSLSSPLDGVMTPNGSYQTLSTENSGGQHAALTVVAMGGASTLTFAVPQLSSSDSAVSATPEIKYTSQDGHTQDYTSQETTVDLLDSSDHFELESRISSASVFAAGRYEVTTVVTCAAT